MHAQRSSSWASTRRNSRASCNKNTPVVRGSGTTPGVTQELESTADEIANLTGTRPTLWRPPFGGFNDTVTRVASSLGLSMRLWDVNPRDPSEPGTDVIVRRVVDNVSEGDIILLHDGSPDGSEDRSQTVAALPTIIDTLRARGFEFGTLSTTTAARAGPTGPDVLIGDE